MIGKFWRFLSTTKARFNFLYGGANSGKSYSMGQFFIKKFFEGETNKEFLVMRKTLPALRITAYKLILDLISSYDLPRNLNKSEMVLTFNHNNMYFKSLDDPEKIKSFNVNYIWAEELTEFTLKDFRRLNFILRNPTNSVNQLFGTFNPVDVHHWINTKFVERGKKNVATLPSTYKDNPFVTQDYIDELEDLKFEDENYYRVYTLGEWGVLKNIIYNNWDIKSIEKFPTIEFCDEVIYGIDFGFTNPSVILELRLKDGEWWERELLYETHLTNPELIEKAKILIPDRSRDIYCDSAEPDRIKEFKTANFNARGAKKGGGSVNIGIDFVKRQKVHISKDSVNHIKEKRAYKYKEDTSGNVLEEPVAWFDHSQDAERMAIYTHLTRMGVKKGKVFFSGLDKVKERELVREKQEGLKKEDKGAEGEKEKRPVILSSHKGRVYFGGR